MDDTETVQLDVRMDGWLPELCTCEWNNVDACSLDKTRVFAVVTAFINVSLSPQFRRDCITLSSCRPETNLILKIRFQICTRIVTLFHKTLGWHGLVRAPKWVKKSSSFDNNTGYRNRVALHDHTDFLKTTFLRFLWKENFTERSISLCSHYTN